MAPVPEMTTTASAIMRWHESAQDTGRRPHLGASVIGRRCARHLWYVFRWAKREVFPGRILRLFAAGQRFEEYIGVELQRIGVEFHALDESTGEQFRVSAHGGHFGGSMDGAGLGFPEAPKSWHVVEFKTHSEKSFADLSKNGVEASKHEHYCQMQVYMGLTGMDRAMYIAENKNTSDLYCERVHFDKPKFDAIMARAAQIIGSAEPPPRISTDPAWHECQWCPHKGVCHGTDLPEVNCRTCAHSTPVTDGEGARWVCEQHKQDIDVPLQRHGCEGHRFIPIMLEQIATVDGYEPAEDGNVGVRYSLNDGSGIFTNGYPPHFRSQEIVDARHKAMLADPQVQEIKAMVRTARVVA